MMGTIDIDPVRRFALGGDALTEEARQRGLSGHRRPDLTISPKAKFHCGIDRASRSATKLSGYTQPEVWKCRSINVVSTRRINLTSVVEAPSTD
jgi:hypothetical protein